MISRGRRRPPTLWTRCCRVGYVAFAAGLVAATIWILVFRNRVDPLTPATRASIERERHFRAQVDSALVAALEDAETARREKAAATARADSLERVARALSSHADDLAKQARGSRTLQDSAARFEAAYIARTVERDTLLEVVQTQKISLSAAEAQVAAMTRATQIADSGRKVATIVLDQVVREITPTTAAPARCAVPLTFGRIRCPTRTQAAIAGAVGAVVVITARRLLP